MTELEKRVAEIENQIAGIHDSLIIINGTIGLLALKLRADPPPH